VSRRGQLSCHGNAKLLMRFLVRLVSDPFEGILRSSIWRPRGPYEGKQAYTRGDKHAPEHMVHCKIYLIIPSFVIVQLERSGHKFTLRNLRGTGSCQVRCQQAGYS
jgi:hypothetical protein